MESFLSHGAGSAPGEVTSLASSYNLSASGRISPVENAASFFPAPRTRHLVRFGRPAVICTVVAGIAVETVHGLPLPGSPTFDVRIVVKGEWYVPQEHTHSETREGPPRGQVVAVSSVGTPGLASGQFTISSGGMKV